MQGVYRTPRSPFFHLYRAAFRSALDPVALRAGYEPLRAGSEKQEAGRF